MASPGRDVVLDVVGVGPVAGVLQRVGPDWCLAHGAAQDWVVRLAAVVSVEGASARALPEVAWSPIDRLGFGSALRRLAEAGEPCVVHGVDGTRAGGRADPGRQRLRRGHRRRGSHAPAQARRDLRGAEPELSRPGVARGER